MTTVFRRPTRALSVARPWSTLIVEAGKRAENRSWTTHYRGPLLLHASQAWRPDAWRWCAEQGIGLGDMPTTKAGHPTGIVAVTVLWDVCGESVAGRPCSCGPWAMPGQHHWRLDTVLPLTEPIQTSGALGLWRPPADLVDAALERLGPAPVWP